MSVTVFVNKMQWSTSISCNVISCISLFIQAHIVTRYIQSSIYLLYSNEVIILDCCYLHNAVEITRTTDIFIDIQALWNHLTWIKKSLAIHNCLAKLIHFCSGNKVHSCYKINNELLPEYLIENIPVFDKKVITCTRHTKYRYQFLFFSSNVMIYFL